MGSPIHPMLCSHMPKTLYANEPPFVHIVKKVLRLSIRATCNALRSDYVLHFEFPSAAGSLSVLCARSDPQDSDLSRHLGTTANNPLDVDETATFLRRCHRPAMRTLLDLRLLGCGGHPARENRSFCSAYCPLHIFDDDGLDSLKGG